MSVKSIIKTIGKRLNNVWCSESTMKSAFYKIRKELKMMGLLSEGSKLDKVKIFREFITNDAWRGIGGAMGFYSFEDCNIHIPIICSASLAPWCTGRCMTDVLRHEFGHALQDKFPHLVSNNVFIKAFGDVCGENEVAKEGDEDNYVSSYARTNTQEDFAETFMLYMKYKGKLPKEFSRRKAIKAKWAVVESICLKVTKSR